MILVTGQRKAFVTAAVLLGNISMFAQNAAVTATLDSSRIQLGQQIRLLLEATAHAADSLSWPEVKDTLSEKIEIVERSRVDISYDATDISRKTFRQQFVLTSFDSGYHVIPPFTVNVNGQPVESEPLLLEVLSVQVDTAQGIFDIKQPLSVSYTFLDWLRDNWKWLAGVGAAVLAITLLILYFLKRKPAPKIAEVVREPEKPVHILALQKLEVLRKKRLWQSGKVKEYHSELSEIVREYIERRYYIHALEMTTDDILHRLKATGTPEDLRAQLRQVLFLSDLVKFAKEQPLASENEAGIDLAISFVDKTKQGVSPATGSSLMEKNQEPAIV